MWLPLLPGAMYDVFQENVSELLPVFEDFLSNAPGTASYDAVRQSIVILMGSLAKHLDKDNPKVKPIMGQLISALSTPSQEVGSYCYYQNVIFIVNSVSITTKARIHGRYQKVRYHRTAHVNPRKLILTMTASQ